MHVTIESIARSSESEPSKPRRAERQRRTVCEPWAVTRFWRSQIHSRPILGYRECKCNIKYERINASDMRENVQARDNAKCSFCNYDANYFEAGKFWCKYHYWLDSATPSAASLRYLDVITW